MVYLHALWWLYVLPAALALAPYMLPAVAAFAWCVAPVAAGLFGLSLLLSKTIAEALHGRVVGDHPHTKVSCDVCCEDRALGRRPCC